MYRNIYGIIVEGKRRKGCVVMYHNYCWDILDSVEGLFDEEVCTN